MSGWALSEMEAILVGAIAFVLLVAMWRCCVPVATSLDGSTRDGLSSRAQSGTGSGAGSDASTRRSAG